MSTEDLSSNDCLSQFHIEPSLQDGFTINDILVLPRKNEIVKHNQHYHLSRKAMDLLLLLGSSGTQVVSKESISEYIWADQKRKKSSVSGLITEIRRLLDDHADNPMYVQTIPRKGYRLLVPAMPLEQSLLSTEVLRAVTETEESESKRATSFLGDLNYWRNSRLFKVAGTYVVMSWVLMQVVSVSIPVLETAKWLDKLVLLILVAGFPLVLWYNWYIEYKLRKKFISTRNKVWANQHFQRHAYKDVSYITFFSISSLLVSIFLANQVVNAVLNDKNSVNSPNQEANAFNNVIAVMPFTYVGENASNTSAAIFQVEILTFLSQSSTLRVVSERMLSAIPENASVNEINTITGAKYILEGSISEDTSNSRITTILIDATTGHQLWSNRTNVKRKDKLTLVETISRQVYNALTFLMPQEKNTLVKFKPTDDIQAYDFYIRAKETLKDAYNIEDLRETEQLFLKALGRDNQFESAQAGLCQTYLEQYRLLNQTQIFSYAKQACELSIYINNDRADPEIALGRLYLGQGNYGEALVHFDKALAIEPSNSIGLTAKARTLGRLDRNDEADELFLAAIKAEPGYWRNFEEYGSFLFNRGQYEKASLQFHKQSLLQPESEEAFNNLGAAYYLNNDYEKAIDSWRAAAAIKPSANTFSNLGTSMYFTKQFDNAVAMYNEAVKRNPNDFVLMGNLADAMKYATDMRSKSLDVYQEALALAQASDLVNPNNNATKASMARYKSELDKCTEANNDAEDIVAAGLDDPYTYYELAAVINNCGSKSDALVYIEETLKLGYPSELLLKDPQFEEFHTQILQIQSRVLQ